MLDSLFQGIFDSSSTVSISAGNFLLCIGAALILGLILAAVGSFRNRVSHSYAVTLALLPAVVCVIIMMVNGNIGAGVAVAGAFGLVRFRSQPGTAREIVLLFLAMGAGMITGMGYIGYGFLFTAVLAILCLVYESIGFGSGKKEALYKVIRVTIPENLDYTGIFDDLFERYTDKNELVSVKTSNMGSMFKLIYEVQLKNLSEEKEMIDEMRMRNGNLEISVSRQQTREDQL